MLIGDCAGVADVDAEMDVDAEVGEADGSIFGVLFPLFRFFVFFLAGAASGFDMLAILINNSGCSRRDFSAVVIACTVAFASAFVGVCCAAGVGVTVFAGGVGIGVVAADAVFVEIGVAGGCLSL